MSEQVKPASEQKPVAIMWRSKDGLRPWRHCSADGNWPVDESVMHLTEVVPLYTTPQPDYKEQRDDLLEALESLRSVCFDRRKSVEEFERLGELYRREFGRLRPGKDDPMHDSCDDENTRQYDKWSRKRTESALDLADAAIASVKGGAA